MEFLIPQLTEEFINACMHTLTPADTIVYESLFTKVSSIFTVRGLSFSKALSLEPSIATKKGAVLILATKAALNMVLWLH